MDPELWEMLEEGDSEDEVAAIIRLGQPGIVPPGVRVIVQFGEIVTVRMKRGSILDIREEAEVASFKAPGPPMGPDMELDDTELLEGLPEALQPSDERRPPSLDATGCDVVVGIVDWGLDFAHPDFRNPDGSTRILALWDQRGRPRPESPQPYGYGLVHTREEINRALAASDPYAALGYHPADADMGRGSHATLVASIAAGNGGSGSPVGIAPEAKIVFVHFATWGQDGSARLGNSVTLLEAVDFIARTAGERPWVINLSMGRTGEQHDGTTLVEQGLDAVLRAAPGHVTCHSTGNYFTRLLHASGQLRPAEERTLVWEVMKADVTPNELEIWYPGRDKMEVEIRSPSGVALARLKLGERAPLIANGQTVGRGYHREAEPNNLANHIDIFLYAGAPAGAWEVTLSASDVVDGRFHAWIERDAACPDCQSHFRREDADPTSTTGTICNGLRTIAVGAYNPHHPDQPVAPFSSMGPTRDSRLKPDLCAPGVGILGARSAPRDANGQAPLWTRMSGTSFAAPHVTGCVALMLQVAPRPLRIEEVHNLLLANTRKVYFPDELPGRVGSGYLDIERAVEAARNIGRIGPELKSASVAKEAAMMREDQEIEMLEFVEGKAEDEAEAEEAPSRQNTFHRIAGDITGAFEGGKPGTLNLYDRGIISYGKYQATLASGTLYPILKRYTELSSSETARKMSAYLDRVKQRDETLREGRDFIQLLKDAAKEPEMNRAQDEEFALQYWEPSKKAAREAGIKSALGYVILYDTRIQGGMQQVLKKTHERLGGKVGDTVGTKEITEQEFLRVFVEERVNRNLRISANQKKQAEELNKEAQALEDAAAAAPDRAPELRGQAADKRKKAKQYAANASALEISANKTRGPSLMALVDSGDLNLYGDTDGKIYLTGKSGVVITGLKSGATIDSTTPAEQVEEEADEEAIAKRNFILISGGPGPYDNRDIEHDQSWANYVTPVLLLTDKKAKREAFVEEDEEVWWFVYKPAYERRWTEDSSSSLEARKKAVKEVKDRGFTSYVDLIEGRAKERGWNLRWLVEADDLWTKLKTFSKGSISRVWYWGHAREDLWLSVRHDPDTGAAIAPEADEIIKVSSIDSKLKNRFRKGDVDRMNRFIGCNTVKFAEAWAKTFDVWAEGVEGKVNFASIHKTGGEPCLVDSARVTFFSPGGKEEPGQAWRVKAVKCGTISSEALPEEAEALEAAASPADGRQTASQTVQLKVGETYEIPLDSAPSTGHSWEVLLPQEAAGLISFTEVVYESTLPPTSDPWLIPLGGREVRRFRFRALAPGEVKLSLLYRQPGVKLNVSEERVVSVRIHPATPGEEEAFAPSEAPAAAEAPETDAAELVELADQVIAERTVAHAPTAVLHHVLSRAGMAEALTLPGSGRLASAAEIFDAFAYPGREALRSQLEQYFEVVALPRTPLDSELRTSDLLFRRIEGGRGHLSVIASPELRPYQEVLSEGLIPEAFSPGKYAHVVDAGARPHTLSDAFARRVADDTGRLPYDQLVLRTQENVRQRIAESIQLDESVKPPNAETSGGSAPSLPPAPYNTMPLGLDFHDALKGKVHPVTDFQRLVRLGKTFVILKASQGGPDQVFTDHYKFARQVGLLRGAYHFFTANPVLDQVNLFVGLVRRLGPGDLPPSLDVEDGSLTLFRHYNYIHHFNDGHREGNQAGTNRLLDDLQEWLDRVEAALGRTPIIYTGTMWRDDLQSTRMSNYPLWTIPRHFSTQHWSRAEILQYAEDGGNWLGFAHYREPNVNIAGTQYDAYQGSIHGLRGLADLGHTAPHLVGNLNCIAYTEPDGRIHLLEYVAGSWRDQDVFNAPFAHIIGTLPLAAGDPAAVALGNEQVIIYRSANDGVHALTRTLTDPEPNWRAVDITAGGGKAIDDPFVLLFENNVHVIYWDQFNAQVHVMRVNGVWKAESFVDRVGPNTPSQISGSATAYKHQNVLHVVSRSRTNGHLMDFSAPAGGAPPQDLTAASHGAGGVTPPAATYRPATYTPTGKAARIVFRAVRGDVWQIERDTLNATNLRTTAVDASNAGGVAPTAVGSPTAIFVDVPHIFYRTVAGTIIDLFGDTNSLRWREVCIDAAADPTAFVDSLGHAALSFRAIDGSIRVARFVNGAWKCENATRPQSGGSGGSAPGGPEAAVTQQQGAAATHAIFAASSQSRPWTVEHEDAFGATKVSLAADGGGEGGGPAVVALDPFPNTALALSLADNGFLGINPSLSSAMSALAANPATKDMCVAVVDLQAPPVGVDGVYQGFNDDDMLYVGSLQKISAMYAAFELRSRVRQHVAAAIAGGLSTSAADWQKMLLDLKTAWQPKLNAAFPALPPGFPDLNTIFSLSVAGKVDFSTSGKSKTQLDGVDGHGSLAGLKFHEWLKLMLRWSNNQAASKCILALSYPYINGVLKGAGLFVPASTGIFSTPPRGLWISGNYAVIAKDWIADRTADDANAGQAKTARWATPQRPKTNFGATARKVAQLFALIAKDRLVDAAASQEMRDLLSGAELNRGPGTTDLGSFIGGALRDAGRSYDAVYSKIGIGDDNRLHDAGIVQRAIVGGKSRYVVVALGSDNNFAHLSKVFVDIDTAL